MSLVDLSMLSLISGGKLKKFVFVDSLRWFEGITIASCCRFVILMLLILMMVMSHRYCGLEIERVLMANTKDLLLRKVEFETHRYNGITAAPQRNDLKRFRMIRND